MTSTAWGDAKSARQLVVALEDRNRISSRISGHLERDAMAADWRLAQGWGPEKEHPHQPADHLFSGTHIVLTAGLPDFFGRKRGDTGDSVS